MSKGSWSVYMVRVNNGHLYTGISKDVASRFVQHCEQGRLCAKYLRGKYPLDLVYTSFVGSHSDALKKELKIKKLAKIEKEKLIIAGKD